MTTKQSKVKKSFEKAADTATDCIEAVMPATTKAGAVANRVATMDKAGVDHEVIALQMTKKSARGNTYEKAEIPTIVKLYEDCKTRVPLSAKSARALVKDQEKNSSKPKREEGKVIDNSTPLPS